MFNTYHLFMTAIDSGHQAIHVEIERRVGTTRDKTDTHGDVIVVGAIDAFKSTMADISAKTKFLLSQPAYTAVNLATRQRILEPGAQVAVGQLEGQATHFLGRDRCGYAVPAWPHAGNLGRGDFTLETWMQFPDSAKIEDNSTQLLDAYFLSHKLGVSVYLQDFWHRAAGKVLGMDPQLYVRHCDGHLHHVAWTRHESRMTMYLDGKAVARGYLDLPVCFVDRTRGSPRDMLFIGKRNSSNPLPRHLLGLRIIEGLAVYKGDFIPIRHKFIGARVKNIKS